MFFLLKMFEEPSFTNVNYSVCMYCSNLMIFDPKVASISVDCDYGCKLMKDSSGRYRNISKYERKGDKLSIIEKGCDSFESSRLPSHPIVLEELIEINPRTESIPSDENAIETSWDFGTKVKKYIPKENFLRNANEIV